MHVLFYTSGYPNPYNKNSHIFLKELVCAVSQKDIKVGLICAIPISLKKILQKKKVYFGLGNVTNNEDDLIGFYYLFPAVPYSQFLTNHIGNFIGKKLINKYIRHYGKPDLIHLHVSFSGIPVLYAREKYNIPFILTEHYSMFLMENLKKWRVKLVEKVIKTSNKNIAVSERLAVKLKNRFKNEFEVLPNTTNTDTFILGESNLKSSDTYTFINIGNLVKQKNQELLIKAFASAFRNDAKYRLIIVGEGAYFSRLLKLITRLKMNDRIALFGVADRNQVLTLLQNSDCFVLSSEHETFGVVLIEAMSCGLPVLSTKCGGPESIIVNDKLGLLCEINEKSYAEGLKLIVKQDFDSSYIRSYVVENYSTRVICDKLISIYESEITS